MIFEWMNEWMKTHPDANCLWKCNLGKQFASGCQVETEAGYAGEGAKECKRKIRNAEWNETKENLAIKKKMKKWDKKKKSNNLAWYIWVDE